MEHAQQQPRPTPTLALEPQSLSLGFSSTPWLPTPSPSLRLPTPTLEVLAGTDWAGLHNNPTSSALAPTPGAAAAAAAASNNNHSNNNTQQNHPQHLGSTMPFSGVGLSALPSAGLSALFSPKFDMMSPGVSGGLAGTAPPAQPGQHRASSLTELFLTPEYASSFSPAPRAQKNDQQQPPSPTPPSQQQQQTHQHQQPQHQQQQHTQPQQPQHQPQQQQLSQQTVQQQQLPHQHQGHDVQPEQQQRQQQQQPSLLQHPQQLEPQYSHQSHQQHQHQQMGQQQHHFQPESQFQPPLQRQQPRLQLSQQSHLTQDHRQLQQHRSNQPQHDHQLATGQLAYHSAMKSEASFQQGLQATQPVQSSLPHYNQYQSAAVGALHQMSGGALDTSFNSGPVQSGAMSSGSTDTGAGPLGPEVRLSKKPRPARKSYAASAASALDTKVRMEASAVEAAASAAAAKAERFASERRMQRAAAAEASGVPAATKRSREEDTSDIENGGGLSSDADATLAPDELKKKRYQRRLELNRQSAAVSRVRRREYVKELEEKLVSVEKEKFKLQSQVDLMGDENSRLRTQMKNLQSQMGKPPAGEQARAPRGSRGSGNSRRSSGTQ